MTLTIVFIRHGKSLHPEYISFDIERHLAPRGYVDVSESANWCVSQKLAPDLMITSPAIRAYSTAMLVANVCDYPLNKLVLNASVYNASADALFYVLNEINSKHRCVFLFGHNPGFTDIVNLLCGPVITHLPTSAVAVVQIDRNTQGELIPGTGQLKTVFSSHKEME